MGASQGILDKLKEQKNNNSKESKKENSKIVKYKRSYSLSEDAIKDLDRLKLEHYPVGTNLEDIVDEAIKHFYNYKKSEGK